MAKEKNPKIRFNEFTEDWEQRKLKDIGSTFTGLSGKTKEDFGHGEAKFVTYLNIFNNPITDPYLLESVEVDKKQNEVKYGDIFFTTSSETPEEVGMSSIWLKNQQNVYLNSFCFGFRPQIEFDPYFMAFNLRSAPVRKNLIFLAQGVSRFNISKNKVMDMNISLPSIEEQKKIGSLFKQLENSITLQHRKHEKLKNTKQAMLKKMFPKKGEKFPEIRFKGFTEAWEQRKVSELVTSYSGGTPKSGTAEYYDGDIPFIRSGEINNDKTELNITKLGMDNSSAKMVHKGDILYALYGATSGEVSRARLDGAINQAILALLPNKDINADFLVEWFRKEKSNIIATFLQGGQGNLSAQIIKELVVAIPSSHEQKKIGDYFSILDNLITLQQRKLDYLKNIKKSFLQKCFP